MSLSPVLQGGIEGLDFLTFLGQVVRFRNDLITLEAERGQQSRKVSEADEAKDQPRSSVGVVTNHSIEFRLKRP